MGRFEVDLKGLAKLVEKRGWAWVIHELVQNGWDEDGVTEVRATLVPIAGRPEAILVVEDDAPEGFRDLAHSYTLFAESYKKGDPEKRGRFNLGEKLVLALAIDAEIMTTKGTITFRGDERMESHRKSKKGSTITARFRMTHAECEEVARGACLLIPPAGITTTFNGELLEPRHPLAELEWTLPTEIADADGVLRPSERKTIVRLYEPRRHEKATLYEKGIPVVETGDRWHLDVQQKIPLTMDRDNVRPSYLRAVRTFTLNAMHESLNDFEFNDPWVAQAVQDKRVEVAAVASYVDAKYGKERVTADPMNPESVSRAQAAGFTVIQGGSESGATWEKIREGGLALPAGQAFPMTVESTEKVLPESEWTPGIRNIVAYAKALASRLIDCDIGVTVVNDSALSALACFGQRHLTFNVGRLGWSWFERGVTDDVNRLLIHEFGHDSSINHLSDDYYQALCNLGARMVRLALDEPEFFRRYGTEVGR
jgi:hypothetical protein